MKKTSRAVKLLMVFVLFCAAPLFAQEDVLWGSYYAPFNLIPGGAIAYEQDSGTSLGLYPSLEIILAKPVFSGLAFADFGLEIEAHTGIPLKESSFTLGPAVLGTMHLGFKGFDFPGSEYLDRVDLYAKIGFGLDVISPDGLDPRFAVSSGVNYFLDERLMAGVGYTTWGTYSGIKLEARYRFGLTPPVSGMRGVWTAGAQGLNAAREIAFISRFYSYFFFAFYSGGAYWAPDTYLVGDGSVWRYRGSDSKDEFFIERSYIEQKSDGTQWWRLKYYDDTEEVVYEFSITAEQRLGILRYRDEDAFVREYSFDMKEDVARQQMIQGGETVSSSSLAERAKIYPREDITVPAGTFRQCYSIRDEVEGEVFAWWFTDKGVPGLLVKYEMTDEEDTVTAELYRILNGQEGRYSLGETGRK